MRYTFFETAVQKGYLLEVWNELLPRHFERGVYECGGDGNSFGFVARLHGRDEPEINFTTTGRQQVESNAVWRDRVKAEAHKVWAEYTKRREKFLAEQQALKDEVARKEEARLDAEDLARRQAAAAARRAEFAPKQVPVSFKKPRKTASVKND